MKLPRLVLGALVALAGMSISSVAHADAPTNSWLFAAQPIPASTKTVAGTLYNDRDTHWYTFAVSGIQQIHLSETGNHYCLSTETNMYDAYGNEISWSYTTPEGVNRYYISIEGICSDDQGARKYTLTVDGPGRVDPPPLPIATPTGEPNETQETAAGPLVDGQWYSGSIDTSNDNDWFTFFVAPGTHQLMLSAVRPPGAVEYLRSADVSIVGLEQSSASTSARLNEIGTSSVTVTGPRQLWVKVTASSVGMPWWFSVTGGVVPTYIAPPPPPAPPAAPQPRKITRAKKCRISTSRVKKRGTIRGTCQGLKTGSRLEARWYRYTTRSKKAQRASSVYVTVRKSRVRVPTRGRARGFYRVTLIHQGKRVATKQLRIR